VYMVDTGIAVPALESASAVGSGGTGPKGSTTALSTERL
jgi:hypothetical protein